MSLLTAGFEKLIFENLNLVSTLAGKIHLTIFAAHCKRGISFFTRLWIFDVMSPPIGLINYIVGVGWAGRAE